MQAPFAELRLSLHMRECGLWNPKHLIRGLPGVKDRWQRSVINSEPECWWFAYGAMRCGASRSTCVQIEATSAIWA